MLTETHCSARLRLGDPAAVVGDLEAAVAAHGYREGLWELLITALYRAGRQADALAAYQRVRSLLADELGLEPGPRLQQLERQILHHDPALGGPACEASGNLPSMSAELVGREPELAALADLLQRGRLVELLGPGGVGKTAVAIAAGRRLSGAPGGVWLARLEAATTADDVLDTLVAAMHVTGGEAALLERVKGPAAVLILDNCEHVVDAAAALAVRLLDAARGLRILCTSQVPLDVEGELVLELAPLDLPDAVELFTRRAAARHRDACRRRGRGPLPLARRPPARDRARGRTDEDAVDRGDRPPPRRPLRRAARPDQPQARAPACPQGHDPVELRAAVPRRQARALGAGRVRRRRAAPRGRVRPRGARRARVSGDRRGRTPRRPLARDRRRRRSVPLPAARQHPRVRARRDGGGRADRARARRARRMVRAGGRILHRGRPRQRPGRGARASRGTSARTSTPPWPGAPRTTRSSGSPSSTGSAGPGSSSATAGARSASSRRSTPPGTRPRAAIGPPRCCSPRGSRRPPGISSPLARTSPRPWTSPTRSATSTCRHAAATTSPMSSRTTASSGRRSR